MSDQKKAAGKSDHFPESKGVEMARRTRKKANDMTAAQREKLTAQAMKVIHGGNAAPDPVVKPA